MRDIKYLKIDFYSILLYSLFLLPLFGSGIPAYIVAIFYLFYRITTIRFKLEDVCFLGVIVIWYLIKCQQTDIQSSTILLRYYFGFYIFYLFFNNIDTELNLDKLLLIISIFVILEAVLINTVIKPEWLPNYPKSEMGGELVFTTSILGFYQRPYSIGTNSTITSTLIMVLLFYNYSSFEKLISSRSNTTFILAIIAIIILGSGTGYVLLLLFVIYRVGPFKNSIYATISFVILFLMYYLIFVLDVGSINGLEKISSTYFQFLYDYKATQIDDVKRDLLTSNEQFYIGKEFEDASQLVIWSDFAWNNLLLCTGLMGTGITILIFIFKINKYNWVPAFIFIVGAIHYGAMYSLPGQLLLGYFFSSKFKFRLLDQTENCGRLTYDNDVIPSYS